MGCAVESRQFAHHCLLRDRRGLLLVGADTLTGTTLRCLLPDTEYFVGVRARNDHGYSPWSEPVSQWTRMPPSPPQTPGGGGSGSSGSSGGSSGSSGGRSGSSGGRSGSSGGRSGSSSGGSGGSGSLEDLSGYLENPGADSFQSGIGVISGWVCEAETVEIEIETEQGEVQRQPAAYGTERWTPRKPVGTRPTGLGCCSTGTCWVTGSMRWWRWSMASNWTGPR